MDETSISVWNNLKKRTWTDGLSVSLPLQSKRGRNKTVIGAIGGSDQLLIHSDDLATDSDVENEYFMLRYKICKRTCKEEVLNFFRLLL